MKKLSLLFSATILSLAAMAQLNPYAYGLTSSWDNATKKLTVTYFLNSDAYNDGAGGNPDGVQICLTDDKNNPKKYYIYGVPATNIGKGTQTFTIDLSSGLDLHGKTIPENKNLYVTVTVQGNRKISNPYMYSPGNNANNEFKVYSPHGIAVDKDPNSPNFGNIYVNEGLQETKTGFNTGRAGMYVIDATFDKFNTTRYTGDYDFGQCVIENTYDGVARKGYQPWRVRVSDDGRIFVCSNDMHQRQATNAAGERDGVAVWEVDRNNFHNWTPVLKGYRRFVSGQTATNYTFAYKDVNGVEQFIGPICGMDVKGTGDDVTLLLYTVNQAGVWLNMNGFRAYEYNVKSGALKPVTAFNNGGYGYVFEYTTLRYGVDGSYWFGASRADGSDGNNTNGKTKEPNLGHVKLDGATADYTNYNAEFFAGAGLINYKSTYNNETINGANHSWLIAGKDNGGNANGLFDVFLVTSSADGGASVTRMDGKDGRPNWQGISVKNTGRNLNDFAIDYAENLYIAGHGGNGGRVCAFAMPYGGEKTTIAREQFAFKYQNPVPNILATDLRYDIVRGKNQYEFSFNVNTKPEEAQIRFYSSYDAMKNSLNVVNADNYDGTNANKPVYVYNIPDDQLKQGRIAVKLGAVGGQADANGMITNDRLPAGVLYWSVYVKTRKSNAFAPTCRLEGINDAQGAHRRYATVNNYPETDMFGSFIVADCPTVNSVNGPYNGLMIYGINPDGNSNDEQSDISNGVRYSHRESYLNSGVASASDKLNFPRRLVVAPDGRVFIADQGTTDAADYAGATTVVQHVRGGVRIWDPADPKKFTLFSHNKIGTSFGVSLWEHPAANGGLKIYASNAYEEYLKHNTTNNYTDQQKDGIFGWNGLAEYTLSAHPNGSENWSNPDSVHYALGRGDASGNYSLVAMDKGIWMCQHREHNRLLKDEALQPLADNLDAVLLSFFPYGSTKAETWNSCTTNGVNNYDDATNRAERADASDLTQKKTSPIQSTPGAGMAYRKIDGKEYLFVVNHDGNIAQILIDGWTGSGATATPTIDASKVKILVTPAYTKGDRDVDNASTKWHTAFITTINFDYAGNLVTTTGKSFGNAHDIIVYTMPYDRVNAREIQAPNSCRMIPERIAHFDMDKEDLDELIKEHKIDHPEGCAIDLYRPLQGGMFNTICLPCTLDLRTLPESHPLYEAELKEYTGLNLNTVGGEKVLELVFTNVSDKVIIANKPYIIEPKDDYNSIIRFADPLRLTNTTGEAVDHEENSKNYNITYQGIIPYQEITPVVQDGVSLTLMLVSDNRLAEMTTKGYMYGFRGYFQLNQPLPKGMQTRITTSKGTTTNTTIVVDGKKVNVEKFLQEGRVYIRMGDSLYTIDGQKVE